jgi:hypothetical protein
MKYLFQHHSDAAFEPSIVVFLTNWRFEAGVVCGEKGWFSTLWVGPIRCNIEVRTPSGYIPRAKCPFCGYGTDLKDRSAVLRAKREELSRLENAS